MSVCCHRRHSTRAFHLKTLPFLHRLNLRDVLVTLALALIVALVWSWYYYRLDPASWNKPVMIGGDGSLVTSFMEAAREGDFTPWQLKGPHRLGAPFEAEWNTWPITEEFLCWTGGIIGRVVGLPAAVNFMLMSAHALAAVSFYWACRLLGKPRFASALFGLLFGLSYFIFRRGLGHLTVGYCWHVPLCWVVVCYAFSARGVFKNRRRTVVSLGCAVVAGLQNPYFTFIFGQFLGFAFLAQALRRRSWRGVLGPAVVAAVLFVTFLSMQADTLLDRIIHHRQALGVERSYLDMELYALKPMDLVLPFHWKVPFFEQLARTYVQQRVISSEYPLGFLGVVAVVGALLLTWITLQDLLLWNGQLSASVRKYALPPVWIVALGMVGGVVGMGALLTGAYFLRGSNRFSIFIVALLMFFLVDAFALVTRRKSVWIKLALATVPLLAAGLEIRGLRMPPGQVAGAGVVWNLYGGFLADIEKTVGRGAMLFNLPAVDFPETVPLAREDPYAPLLLYDVRSSLRFSYGDMRGDYRDTWQRTCAQLPPEKMVAELRRYGFRGLLVSCWAYPDKGKQLIDSLSAVTGRPAVIIGGESFAFVSLGPPFPPAGENRLPPTANVSAQEGWWPLEYLPSGDTLLWSKGDSKLALYRDPAVPAWTPAAISLQISTPTARTLRLGLRDQTILTLAMRPNVAYPLESLRLPVKPGWNILDLRTDQAAALRPDVPADSRAVSLNLRDVEASGLAPRGDGPPAGVQVKTTGEIDPKIGKSFGGVGPAEVIDAGGRRWREFYAVGSSLKGFAGRPASRIEFLPGGSSFCVLVRVVPGTPEVDYATILSSLTQDFHGLTLERGPGEGSVYNAAIGVKDKFIPVDGPLPLLSGQAYLLALNVSGQDLTLRIRGGGSDVTMTHHGQEVAGLSAAYWRWGNWMLESRPFAGQIELLSMGPALPPAGVAQLLDRHKTAIPSSGASPPSP